MRTIRTLDELREQIGKEVAISPWVRVDQQRIDLFAQATGDHQWIHVDQERASQESAFGTTIAHGYLTLSLLPDLMSQAVTLPPSEMSINYGLNKVRFPAPVPQGSMLRARIKLKDMRWLPAMAGQPEARVVELIWESSIECDGMSKPACVAETISRRYDRIQ